jgi:hypothetical protein
VESYDGAAGLSDGRATSAQTVALQALCVRFGVEYKAANFRPVSDLPSDWVAGWVGDRIYVGCDPDGEVFELRELR